MLERSPVVMWPTVSNPLILWFASSVAGPCIQLGALALAALPSMSKEHAVRKVGSWHCAFHLLGVDDQFQARGNRRFQERYGVKCQMWSEESRQAFADKID